MDVIARLIRPWQYRFGWVFRRIRFGRQIDLTVYFVGVGVGPTCKSLKFNMGENPMDFTQVDLLKPPTPVKLHFQPFVGMLSVDDFKPGAAFVYGTGENYST